MTEKSIAMFFALVLGTFAFTNSEVPMAHQLLQNQLDLQVKAIVSQSQYEHAHFGVEVYSLDEGRVVYLLNGEDLFIPGSTAKLLTEGTALELLGPEHRFHTRVYKTGPVDSNGTLKGDLVLVASGDPNLSGRIESGAKIAFENEDHSYSESSSYAKVVPGDPLLVIRELASQVAAHGIKKLDGRVMVDASLFPEGERELGTGVVISPISLNDNLIDLTIRPSHIEGALATIEISPETSYLALIDNVVTGSTGSKPEINVLRETSDSDSSVSVTISGSIPLDSPLILRTYSVPKPSRFAQVTFTEALRTAGIQMSFPTATGPGDFKDIASAYVHSNLVAEHISPPLSEEIRLTLKVSQNLHAAMMPFILGAVLKPDSQDPGQNGFDLEHDFLAGAGLDLTSISQADGAGLAPSSYISPDFMVHYLAFMSKEKSFSIFEDSLPVLGKDGSLWNIESESLAAGHVYAKPGTFESYDALNKRPMLNCKGLAGYMNTADGRHLAFAAYVNHFSNFTDDPAILPKVAGRSLAQIATAIYSTPSNQSAPFDVIIKNGHILDGGGGPWYAADVGIRGDRIAAIGNLTAAPARAVIDATGRIVSPGFIDMLGQSELTLLIDNRSLSKLSQGITSEITGEGGSAAPQNARTLQSLRPYLDQYHLIVDWQTLDDYFRRLESSGTPINLGTYVGAGQVREAVIGDDDRPPTPHELEQMEGLVAQAMKEGALGISTALIYPPGHYAKTDELIALAKVAARSGGVYGTHMRSEGATEMSAIDEAIQIGQEADIPVEIFHLKVAGKSRWGRMQQVVARIQKAREKGTDIRADMYPYLAGATALASALPPWAADGGTEKLLQRLTNPEVRAHIKRDMAVDHSDWENLYYDSGGGTGVVVSFVFNPSLRQYVGKTIAQIAKIENKSEMDTFLDFILADKALSGALFFVASENDLTYGLRQPWTSICLDANELSLDGPLFEPGTHPRSFGAFPRFLGHYVRDEHLMSMSEAIRKITSLPAQREHLTGRGLIKVGFYADITVFDPTRIIDRATYKDPAQISEGIDYVYVNGQLEYDRGKLTGAKGGRALRGPGWNKDD